MKAVGALGGPAHKPLPPVLYVEDEDDNWEVAQLLLGRQYELTRARNAREAVAALQGSAQFSAILMDIQLSGSFLDGIQITKLLRGTLPQDQRPPYANDFPSSHVPVIFLTAYTARYTEAALVAVGGNAMLTKPIDRDKLVTALEAVGATSAPRASGS